jgi:hypothetical protein
MASFIGWFRRRWTMRRFLVLALGVSALGAISCGDKLTIVGEPSDPIDVAVRQVVVSPASATITPGGQVQLGVSIDAGAGVSNRTVTWTSTDTAIASVSQTGLVTSRRASGVVTITAASNWNPAVTATSRISVVAASSSPVRASK